MSPIRLISPFIAPAAAVLAALLATAPADAQPVEADPETSLVQSERQTPSVFTSAQFGFEYQFDSDVNGPQDADMSVARYAANVGVRAKLMRDLDLSLRLGYQFSDYDFDGPTVLGPEPWERIHNVDVGAVLDLEIMDDWNIFGGPVLALAFEEGADVDDAIYGGGVLGFRHRVDESLTIGAGLGVITQLEENSRFFPVIVVDWHITDNLRLATNTRATAFGRTGAELIFELTEQWEIALGGGYDERRFRLDDQGPVPGGVGEDRSFPIWFRATYKLDRSLQITGHVGFRADGEVKVDDPFGRTVSKTEYDPPLTLGITASIRF